MRIAILSTSVVLGVALASDALAAPSVLPERRMDLELREANVRNVFALLGQAAQVPVNVDPCVTGKVDVKLKNTPLPLVFDALASKLSLTWGEDGGAIVVTCANRATADAAVARVTLHEQDAPLPDVAARLAAAAHLDGVEWKASKRPNVSVTVEGVRVATALGVLADSSGLTFRIEQRRLVVRE